MFVPTTNRREAVSFAKRLLYLASDAQDEDEYYNSVDKGVAFGRLRVFDPRTKISMLVSHKGVALPDVRRHTFHVTYPWAKEFPSFNALVTVAKATL